MSNREVSFERRFLKNVLIEFSAIFINIVAGVRIIFLITVSMFLFLAEFYEIRKVVGWIKTPLLLYLIGTFLTQLPLYVVLILMFFPFRIVMPIYILAFLAMFIR